MKILLLGEIEFTSNYFRRICELNSWEMDNTLAFDPTPQLDLSYDLYIISDYPSANLGEGVDGELTKAVQCGKGLLMVGGWSSFKGLDGNYGGTKIGDILPVACLEDDDRINFWGGLQLKLAKQHWIVSDLDWENPPAICGYNKVNVKDGARIIIETEPLSQAGELELSVPLLALSNCGRGRVSAYMSDLVPHWCAGFVDWGEERVGIKGFEFGIHYVTFVSRLMAWTAGLDNYDWMIK